MAGFIQLPYSDYMMITNILKEYLNDMSDAAQKGTHRRGLATILSILEIKAISPVPSCPPPLSKQLNMLERIKEQIDYYCFEGQAEQSLVDDICLIITDLMLADTAYANGLPIKTRINGMPTDIAVVQEVYKGLTADHIYIVARNFLNLGNRVTKKRAYILTALYNATMEINIESAQAGL